MSKWVNFRQDGYKTRWVNCAIKTLGFAGYFSGAQPIESVQRYSVF